MTFVSLPNASQSLGETRDQVRTNMDDLRSNDAVNHYDTNDANRGNHKFSNFVEQTVDPSTTTTGGLKNVALFSKQVSGETQLFLRPDDNGTAIQFSSIGGLVDAASGGSTMFGDIQVRWGSFTGSGAVTFAFNFTTACYHVFLQKQSQTANDNEFPNNYSTGGFTANNCSGLYSYLAIGT